MLLAAGTGEGVISAARVGVGWNSIMFFTVVGMFGTQWLWLKLS